MGKYFLTLLLLTTLGMSAQDTLPGTIFDYRMRTISGEEVSLSQYAGKVVLIVNTASECGYTPQYEGLQRLYEQMKDRGFVILGFPSNDFGSQEPGSDEQIRTFCESRYHVTFPMFSKITVKGPTLHPLYKFLTDINLNGVNADPIKWNFQKILVGKNGKVIRSFSPQTKPESNELRMEIEKALRN